MKKDIVFGLIIHVMLLVVSTSLMLHLLKNVKIKIVNVLMMVNNALLSLNAKIIKQKPHAILEELMDTVLGFLKSQPMLQPL